MAFIPKPNTGTLWPNERKNAPTHPDKRGDLVLDKQFILDLARKSEEDTIKIAISGWEKVIAGKDCLSLSASLPYVKPTDDTEEAPAYSKPASKAAPIDDDEIPF